MRHHFLLVFPQRKSQSNIIPPDPHKFQIKKTRKLSLISFRSHSIRTSSGGPVANSSELQSMLLPGTLPGRQVTRKASQSSKTEMYSLGFNKCHDCLTLTDFQYIGDSTTTKEEKRLRCESSETSLNSSVTTFLDLPEHEVNAPTSLLGS